MNVSRSLDECIDRFAEAMGADSGRPGARPAPAFSTGKKPC